MSSAVAVSPHPLVDKISADYPLLVIVGPTAAGKSALAIEVAEYLCGEVLSCDSVQVYRGFDVGSGKLPLAARRGVPHHLLDLVDPDRLFTAGDYRREGLVVLAGVRERKHLPILVAGTGLYLRALLAGLFEGPARSEQLRDRLRTLAARRGRAYLHRLLRRLDRETAARIAPQDTQKIIRAVEVCILGRQPMSRLLESNRPGLPGYSVTKIGLNPERRQLYARINIRVEQMFATGLLEETKAALARWEASKVKPLEALGYRQARAVLQGEITRDHAIADTQKATRHYAKRQITWFRREPDVTWFDGFGDDPEIMRQVRQWLNLVWTGEGKVKESRPTGPSVL